jgi:diguanylate cyclase (GGDEF)-like protein
MQKDISQIYNLCKRGCGKLNFDLWYKKLEDICEEFSNILVSQYHFERKLKEILSDLLSPLESLAFQMICNPPFVNYNIGLSLPAEPTYVNTINLDSSGVQCKIYMWRKSGYDYNQFDSVKANELLIRLVKNYWKSNLRDDKSKIPSFQYTTTFDLADRSIVTYLQEYPYICSFFCDLDKFKDVNDTHGEDTGDRVILEFSAILDRVTKPHAIAIHRSGDEFIILFPTNSPDQALLLAKEVMDQVVKYDFKVKVKVGTSAGIATINNTEIISYRELETRAEKAVKPGDKIKHRGMARLENIKNDNIQFPTFSEFNMCLAYCILKSNLNSNMPFESPWLNVITKKIYTLIKGKDILAISLTDSVKDLIEWIKPNLDNDIIRASLDSFKDYSPVFSMIDIAFAVCYGIFWAVFFNDLANVSDKNIVLKFNKSKDGFQIIIMPDDYILLQFGAVKEDTEEFQLGGFIYNNTKDSVIDSKLALLIKIGHSELNLPSSLFEEVIVVDDRPTRGGGLPDFWEATIARLVARIEGNANIQAIYVMGGIEFGKETINKLQHVELWSSNIQQIAYKTGMSIQSIQVAQERIGNKVIVPADKESLINHLKDIYQSEYKLEPVYQPTISQKQNRFLHRELNINQIALGRNDGCRVKTIAEAYPVVVEIVRQALTDPIKDQAGEELKELVDFKVHLTNPTQDQIPAFYINEEKSLNDYFKKEFLSDQGLFGSEFQKTGQLQAVLNHLEKTITDLNLQFATRRAILIIPHKVNRDDLAPLGLVSIRCIPRFTHTKVILSYSYTWRTVETLVGFPYSIFGSVKYSEYLTEEVKKRIPPSFSRQIELGEVSYIAHSLHIFMDDYGQNIARRIVDDASY